MIYYQETTTLCARPELVDRPLDSCTVIAERNAVLDDVIHCNNSARSAFNFDVARFDWQGDRRTRDMSDNLFPKFHFCDLHSIELSCIVLNRKGKACGVS